MNLARALTFPSSALAERTTRAVPADLRSGSVKATGAFRAVDAVFREMGRNMDAMDQDRAERYRWRGVVVGFEADASRKIADDLRDLGYTRLLRCSNVQELSYILSVDTGTSFVVVNLDAFDSLVRAVDELRRLRQIAPGTVVVIASHRVGGHDTGTHRAAIADATLRLPCGQAAFETVLGAAFENAASAGAAGKGTCGR